MAGNTENNTHDFEDPYMGAGNGELYIGAGDHSLFGESTPLSDDPLAPYGSPTGFPNAFDFGLGDVNTAHDSNATRSSDIAQAPHAADSGEPATTIPQTTLAPPEVPATGAGAQDDNNLLQLPNPYPLEPLLNPYTYHQQYPLGPLQGPVSGASQVLAGQRPIGSAFPHSASPYGAPASLTGAGPSPGQFGMQPNMVQQYNPYMSQGMLPSNIGQAYPTQNLAYQGNAPMHTSMLMPMPTTTQNYLPTPSASSMAPSPYPQHPAMPGQAAPINQPGQVLEGKKITHNRSLKYVGQNDPSKIYQKPVGLGPWGPLVDGTPKHHLFEYCKSTAELKPQLALSKDELLTFFRGVGHPNPKRCLTLWIQNTAAQSNDRYASAGSSGKCRYKGCRAGQRTILKGFYRVAFDEFSDSTGSSLDPLHNAGYMHLHCFETLFDLGYLIHYGAARLGFFIRPDTRQFPFETRNPASLTRDHPDMINAYNEWVAGQRDRASAIEAQNMLRPPDQWYTGFDPEVIPPHSQRLGCVLTDMHLSLEVKGRARTREARGGAHIGLHRGDLDKYNRLKRQATLRKRREASDGEEDGDDDQQQQRPKTKSQPSQTKKRKRSSEPTEERQSRGGSRSTKRAREEQNSAYEDVGQLSLTGDIYDATPPRELGPQQPQAPPQQVQPQPATLPPELDLLNMPFLPVDPALYSPSGRVRSPGEFLAWSSPSPPTSSPPHHPNPEHHPPEADRSSSPAAGPRTRKRSRETEEEILGLLSARTHLTRGAAHEIQARLGNEPTHVQDHVLAAMPEYLAPVLYDDRLEARVGRLSKRQRRQVDLYTQKQEAGLGQKRYHSF
ncbi:hypothetical protein VTK56DRAFT_4680 [Thermocarpiscus australiensis]